MDCPEFLVRFSEYYDGDEGFEDAGQMAAHLDSCASCRRYHRVVRKGGQLLRALPGPPIPSDFRPRLQHRIYHVEDEEGLGGPVSSGTPVATAMAMAVLVTIAAWSPLMTDRAPVVELDPIVVERAPQAVEQSLPSRAFPLTRPASFLDPSSERDQRLWANTHSLLYEYSPLSERYRQTATVRRSEF